MVKKISDKIIFVLAVSVLFVVGVGVAYIQPIPNPGHSGDSVLISADGYSMTLQEAIDNNIFVDGATHSYTTEVPNPGHTGSEIYVSVKGVEMTLQDAINSIGLCGSGSYSYSSNIVFGHSADEILVSVDGNEMTLQDAINGGEFCIACTSHVYFSCYDNDVYWYDSCDNKEEKKQECGDGGCSGWSCNPLVWAPETISCDMTLHCCQDLTNKNTRWAIGTAAESLDVPNINKITGVVTYPSGYTSNDFPAFKVCEDAVYSGYTNWRLPEFDELESLRSTIQNANGAYSSLSQVYSEHGYWTSEQGTGYAFNQRAKDIHFNNPWGAWGESSKIYCCDYIICIRTE